MRQITPQPAARRRTYRVALDEQGLTRWISERDGADLIYTTEPETSACKRFQVAIMGLLPIKGQL